MNIKKKTIKTIIGTTTACSALMLGGIGAINMLQPKYEIFATGVDRIPVTISNADFDESKKSNYPYSPSSYTAYNQGKKVETSSSVEANVKAGVINLSDEDYETRFASAKDSSRDDYVLMIDSKDEKTNNYHNVNYGFQTNSSTKLEANSKYMFTVDVFSETNSNSAKLYLFDNTGKVFSEISTTSSSYNNWRTFAFFVSTNNYQSLELKLGMYLEGSGTVLFDNLSCQRLSESAYDLSLKTSVDGTFNEQNKIDNVVRTFYINDNGKFEYAEVDTEGVNPTTYHSSNLTHVLYDIENPSTIRKTDESDGFNSNALMLKNEEKTYTQYETEQLFTFEQNRIYKVSVSVKTKNLDGTAVLELIRTDDEETTHNKTLSITSNTTSSSSSVTNDYKTYSFYINSHNTQNVSYKLKFGLGTTESLTTGEFYISEIEVSKINYETFNSTKTGSDAEKIDFVKPYTKDSKIMLQNGDFNAFKIADYNSPMPATPVDWEITTGKNTQKYGVVNTKTFETDLEQFSLSNLTNPSNVNNNVLMMYNATADTLSYKSASKSLDAKSYHKFEVSVQTQNAPLTVSLVSEKDGNEIVIASKTVNTNYLWQDVKLYVYTGYQSLNVSLKLTLNTEEYGYAYIDDAKYNYALTTAELEEEFKSASNSTYTSVVDLSKLLSSNSNEKFAQSNFFSTEQVDNVDTGILSINANYLDEVINNVDSFNLIADKGIDNAYAISSMYDTYHTATSNVGYKLSANKYYKLSVDVYTQGISSNNTEANLDLIGAGIKLTGFDNSFTNINSDEQWTTYTFYIQPQSDITTYVELSLGNKENATKGIACFANIQFAEDVDAEEYNAIKESNLVKIVKAEAKAEETTPEEETKSENKISKTTWIYLIPGLLTAAAILIAVVGIMIRKIKWRNPFKKKSKTAYDRNKTVSVQYYSRKATTLREEKVRELTADLEKINAERKQYEEDYKTDLTRLREMKIKRANPAEIAKLEKDMKKNQKLSANLGVTANRISADLEYAQTDMYLNSLIKKLAREGSTSNKETNEEEK